MFKRECIYAWSSLHQFLHPYNHEAILIIMCIFLEWWPSWSNKAKVFHHSYPPGTQLWGLSYRACSLSVDTRLIQGKNGNNTWKNKVNSSILTRVWLAGSSSNISSCFWCLILFCSLSCPSDFLLLAELLLGVPVEREWREKLC